jgi:hypothetical protein
LFKNLQETLYQWDRPFRVSDAKLRARFPGVGSTLEEAVSEMAATSPSASFGIGEGAGSGSRA